MKVLKLMLRYGWSIIVCMPAVLIALSLFFSPGGSSAPGTSYVSCGARQTIQSASVGKVLTNVHYQLTLTLWATYDIRHRYCGTMGVHTLLTRSGYGPKSELVATLLPSNALTSSTSIAAGGPVTYGQGYMSSVATTTDAVSPMLGGCAIASATFYLGYVDDDAHILSVITGRTCVPHSVTLF